jgi:hypothetical protein
MKNDFFTKEMTNNRMSIFNQDVIPHILRTKLIPPLEEQEARFQQSAKDLQQIKTFDVKHSCKHRGN